MPLLLEDLAEETSGSIRRVIPRFDEAARQIVAANSPGSDDQARAQHAIETARRANDYLRNQLSMAEDYWRSALASLKTKSVDGEAERLLQTLIRLFEAGRGICGSADELWRSATLLGVVETQSAEVDQIRTRFGAMLSDAVSALDHRQNPWRPADPGALQAGIESSRGGSTVTADRAKSWFKR